MFREAAKLLILRFDEVLTTDRLEDPIPARLKQAVKGGAVSEPYHYHFC
jgi:hypothetical protein